MKENKENLNIPKEIAEEVLEVASQLLSETNNSYSLSELQEIGKEVEITPEIMTKALQKVEEKHRKIAIKQQKKQVKIKLFQKIGMGIGVIIILWSILIYNAISSSANKVKSAWAQVENQLQRKADLIPQLISLTEAQTQKELALIKLLNETYTNYQNAQTKTEKEIALNQINESLNSFNQYVLTNPQIQSSEIFKNLQYEIAGTENRIATERMRYNQAVEYYNNNIQSFPNILIASLTSFKQEDFFQAENK